jgi:hypothetical protein
MVSWLHLLGSSGCAPSAGPRVSGVRKARAEVSLRRAPASSGRRLCTRSSGLCAGDRALGWEWFPDAERGVDVQEVGLDGPASDDHARADLRLSDGRRTPVADRVLARPRDPGRRRRLRMWCL